MEEWKIKWQKLQAELDAELVRIGDVDPKDISEQNLQKCQKRNATIIEYGRKMHSLYGLGDLDG